MNPTIPIRPSLLLALPALLLVSLSTRADNVQWRDSNEWRWIAGGFEGGALPGPNDTVVFVDTSVFKARIESGRFQSIGLLEDETIAGIRYENQYGCTINGQFNLTLSSLTALPLAELGTNSIGTASVVMNASPFVFDIGTNHLVRITATSLNETEAETDLVKEGAGTLELQGAYDNHTGDTIVRAGTLHRTGNGFPAQKGNIFVGGGDEPAEILFGPVANETMTYSYKDIVVSTNGTIRYEPRATAVGASYHEYLRVDHGTMDLGGKMFVTYNRAETDRGMEYALCGATITNGGLQITYGSDFHIDQADIPTRIFGRLNFTTAYDITVPDGESPVDFLIDGDLKGDARGIHKAGPGTMLVRCADHIETWGGTGGRLFEIKGGAFHIESSDDGIGMGTNNIVVAAGATYGGVGRHVGAPVQNGLWGNVTLNGTAEARATFLPGRMDPDTGAITPGTYHVGNETQTNNVTFASYGELRCPLSAEGASCLSVNGRLYLSGNDLLSIEGPEKLPAGEYTLATFANGYSNRFAEIKVNGIDLANSPGAVTYRDAEGNRLTSSSYNGAGSIVFTVPEQATIFLVR